MRIVNYMKIDYVLTKQQMRILPLIALIGLVMGTQTGGGEGGIGMMIACAYLLFIATAFSTTPFACCQRKGAGFLLMLPVTVAERVAGRFLYGLSFFGIAVAFCGVFAGVFYLMGYEVTAMSAGPLLCNMAASMLIITFEYVFSYLFGEGKDNWQYLSNFVRIIPGMALFFGKDVCSGKDGSRGLYHGQIAIPD